MLGGAVQYGAMGALTGAATAAVTGGDIGKGALYGAAGGAAMGGLSGLDSGAGGIMQQATGAPGPGSQMQAVVQGASPGGTPIGAGMRRKTAAAASSTGSSARADGWSAMPAWSVQ